MKEQNDGGEYMSQIANKEVLKIVVVGHVDHGKSTVIGKLLYDTKSLPEGAVEKVRRIAKETGKPFEYAYLLDAFEEEQKQGITIDTTQIQFQTEKRDYVIIDAPGHKEFLKNMISGAASAEAALLVIDAKEGVQEQSRRHAYMLSLLGIKKVYVIVNKMDLVDYKEEVFKAIHEEMSTFLGALGVYPLKYIPISAFYGENITSQSDKMPWYKDMPIIESIDTIERDKGIEDKPLRLPIQDVYKFDDRRIIAGRIESGQLKVGDKISIYPEGKTTRIKSIAYWAERDQKDRGFAGESIGIIVEDEFFNKRGEVITHEKDAPFVAESFRASIFWMGKEPITIGKKYKIKLATEEVEGEVSSIVKVIDATSLNSNAEHQQVELNGVAEVIINTKEPVVFDVFSESPVTGRFVIVDGYDVAGGGIITQKESEAVSFSIFKGNGLEARADIFDEFYYSIEDYNIKKSTSYGQIYEIGAHIPLQSKSFNYPSYFDILVLRDHVAISIREGKVTDIVSIQNYTYAGYPVVNGRGFEVNVHSNEEVASFIADYSKVQNKEASEEEKLSEEWLSIETYRKLAWGR